WLATFDGLVRFDGEAFERYDVSTTRALRSNRILALRETPPGTLWAVAQSGDVSWFDRTGAGRLAVPSTTNVLYLDHAGTLWLGAKDGVWRVRGRTAERFAPALLPDAVLVLCLDRTGALWAGGAWGATRVTGAAAAGGAALAATRSAA